MFGWGKETGDVAEGVGNGVSNVIESVRFALTGDLPPEERIRLEELLVRLKELEAKMLEGQVKINMKEAESPNLFKSAWRPAIGWIGVLGIFYHFIVFPTLQWWVTIKGLSFDTVNKAGDIVSTPMILPSIDTAGLFSLVLGMLGIGGYRTYEKYKNITK